MKLQVFYTKFHDTLIPKISKFWGNNKNNTSFFLLKLTSVNKKNLRKTTGFYLLIELNHKLFLFEFKLHNI